MRIKDGQQLLILMFGNMMTSLYLADRELVIYEIHIGEFSGGEADPLRSGQYKHVIEKLDYLVDLGLMQLN
jgi:1,4-alpha-glucan branching enzyme